MYIRLAFSVAANLNPEIVILDEVIAVGDAAFKKKCFERMDAIIEQGHTTIMVNHETAHVRRTSQLCLWLRQGQVEMFGPTTEVVPLYEREMGGGGEMERGVRSSPKRLEDSRSSRSSRSSRCRRRGVRSTGRASVRPGCKHLDTKEIGNL